MGQCATIGGWENVGIDTHDEGHSHWQGIGLRGFAVKDELTDRDARNVHASQQCFFWSRMRVERASHDRKGTGYLVPSKKPGRIERSSHAALCPMVHSFLPSPLASEVDIFKFQALSNAEGPVGRMKRENRNTARRSSFGLPSAFGGGKSPPFGA